MSITGEMLIGASRVFGKNGSIQAVDPATGEAIAPVFGGGGGEDIARACALAKAASPIYRETSLEDRAKFLETIAWNIMETGEPLIARVMQESGLPRGRLEGERGRTVGQLRLFAQVVREGGWIEARIDPALPGRQPAPRPDLRLRRLAVGPVAVFGASNFPLAFSVAGGDTASALAAGCPVVVKAHGAHPGTSLLVGEAIQAAVRQCGLPEGVFSLLFGADDAFSISLVTDPRIKAVGFTGSRGGGTALMASAANRPDPIPVYAEMSSINPVILFPGALAERSGGIARAFASALALGAGQFCTNPGLVLVLDGPNVGAFIEAACAAIGDTAAATMLTPGIHAAYEKGVAALDGNPVVEKLAAGQPRVGPHEARARLFETSGQEFLADDLLQGEVFGPSSLLVRCSDLAELEVVIDAIEGQLTVALHLGEGDAALARPLMPLLETKAGRLLVNGFGTGVEVGHAMVHGGPYPATSDGRSTSVGSLAIERFLRPVCYQDMPGELLPPALLEDNPLGIRRRIDGILQDIATME